MKIKIHLPVFLISLAILFPVKAAELEAVKKIHERKELRVAISSDEFIPFIYMGKDGEYDGIDAKLARDMASELGVKAHFIVSGKSNDSVIEMVSDDIADIGLGYLSISMQRAKKVYFSHPYLVNRYAMLVNSRMDSAKDLDLDVSKMKSAGKGIKLGVISGTCFTENVKSLFPESEIAVFSEWNVALSELKAGKLYGCIDDEFTIKKLLFDNPNLLVNLFAIPIENTRDAIAVAISPSNHELLAWINTYIDEKMIFFKNEHTDEISEYMRISQWMPGRAMPQASGKTEQVKEEQPTIPDDNMTKANCDGETWILIIVGIATLLSVGAIFMLTPKRGETFDER